MLAFVETTVTQHEIIVQLQAHAAADELVKGQYWRDGKGCAVGCTIHSGNHEEYESRFGIPQMLAWLEDCIFERLPNDAAKGWPLRFMRAIKPGSDLTLVGWKFLHWLMTDKAVNPGIDHGLVRDAVRQCAAVLAPLANGEKIDAARARARARASARASARAAARAAADAAASAAASAAVQAVSAADAAWEAASAARSALTSADAADAAADAAWEAASAARSALASPDAAGTADAVADAARAAAEAARSTWASAAVQAVSAADAAGAADAAWAAADAVWEAADAPWAVAAAWALMADKLIELIQCAPVPEPANV